MEPNPTIELSYFTSHKDNVPKALSCTWQEFCTELATPRETNCTCHELAAAAQCHEKHGGAIGVGVYPENLTRGKRNARGAYALALDFDHLTEGQLETLATELVGFKYVAHASHSDRPNDRCIRVFVLCDRFIPAANYETVLASFVSGLTVKPDPAAKDVSRLMFLPSRGRGASYTYGTNNEAPPFCVPELATLDRTPANAVNSPASLPTGANPAVIAAVSKYLETAGQAVQGQGGDVHTYRVCATVCHDFALGESDALPLLLAWDKRNSPPWGVDGLREKIKNASSYAEGERGALAVGVLFRTALTQSGIVEPPPERASELLADATRIDRKPTRIVPTGFVELDKRISGGLWSGRLHAVAAPPGDGKSAWVATVAGNTEAIAPVLLASTELQSDELAARFASPKVGVPWTAILKGEASMRGVLDGMRVRVIGCDKIPRDTQEAISVIATEAAAMREEYGITPTIIVDYMQQLTRGGGEDNARHRVGDVSSLLRSLSQFMDTPVLVVLSVSRTYYGAAKQDSMRNSDDPSVYLAAAKESGDVDYDCAVVIFIDVDRVGDGEVGPRAARLAVAKCRHGSTGFVGARFDGVLGKWTEDAGAVDAIKNSRAGYPQGDKIDTQVEEWIQKIRAWAEEEKYFTASALKDLRDPVTRKREISSVLFSALTDSRRSVYLEERNLGRLENGKLQGRKCLVPSDWRK